MALSIATVRRGTGGNSGRNAASFRPAHGVVGSERFSWQGARSRWCWWRTGARLCELRIGAEQSIGLGLSVHVLVRTAKEPNFGLSFELPLGASPVCEAVGVVRASRILREPGDDLGRMVFVWQRARLSG